MLNGEDQPIRTHAISTACAGTPGLRQGPWKLVFSADAQARTAVQLYNLDTDLGETKNVAAEPPQFVADLQSLMETFITDGRTTPGAKQNKA